MAVDFDWLTDDQTILVYQAIPPWNWKDYYRASKISIFRMHNLKHPVDVVFDLTRSDKLPAGAVGHLRGFGKTPNGPLSGKGVIVGAPHEIEQALTGEAGRILNMGSHIIYFADSINEAVDLLMQARVEP